MALRVSYVDRIGWYTKTERWPDEPEQKYKNWICHANCLWADIYFYKLQEDCRDGKKGQRIAQLIAFWSSPKHLKYALANGGYKGADNFHFYADQMNADIWEAVKILVKAGKKVTIVKSQKKKK